MLTEEQKTKLENFKGYPTYPTLVALLVGSEYGYRDLIARSAWEGVYPLKELDDFFQNEMDILDDLEGELRSNLEHTEIGFFSKYQILVDVSHSVSFSEQQGKEILNAEFKKRFPDMKMTRKEAEEFISKFRQNLEYPLLGYIKTTVLPECKFKYEANKGARKNKKMKASD